MSTGQVDCDINVKQIIDYCINKSKFTKDYLTELTKIENGEEITFLFEDYNIRLGYYNSKLKIIFNINDVEHCTENPFKKFNEFVAQVKNHKKTYYYFEGIRLKTEIDTSGATLFDIAQLTTSLEYSKYHIRRQCKTYKLEMDSTETKIKLDALIVFLNRSRKPKCQSMMEQLGLNTINKIQSKEADVLEKIIEYLDGNNSQYKLQYKCGSYMIDMYLLTHKIAIEVDENGHSDRSPEYEKKREEYIKENLTTKILRINPDASNFRIAKELGKLAQLMAA
ncbi:MAG: BRO-N domain containing protein [Terrestrivirus sp.]|uniref:BRO-N domain containing protein n=1 Tax=Terrestrivirus sp. TaxID=2487775 RepID=A0A3G4ZPA5_9VIRU|nr:MAG: BRO-N domain containing protein [Terrestrivirus sp.]